MSRSRRDYLMLDSLNPKLTKTFFLKYSFGHRIGHCSLGKNVYCIREQRAVSLLMPELFRKKNENKKTMETGHEKSSS